MITFNDFHISSTVDGAERHLAEVMGAAVAHVFHVGMSVRPKQRMYGVPYRYVRVNKERYDGYTREVHVLYKTDAYELCQSAERRLIAACRRIAGDFAQTQMLIGNVRDGGAGRRAKQGPYYVYVAFGG